MSDSLLPFFGVPCSQNERGRIRQAAQWDAKRPGVVFESDTAAKREAAGDELRALAAQWAQPVYERLEQIRHQQRATLHGDETPASLVRGADCTDARVCG